MVRSDVMPAQKEKKEHTSNKWRQQAKPKEETTPIHRRLIITSITFTTRKQKESLNEFAFHRGCSGEHSNT
jgi:hypothetical protein